LEATTAERVTAEERYANGGDGNELPANNLVEAFQKTVDKHGDTPALLTKDETWATWKELRDRVRRIAGGLAKLGVSKGDTVAMLLNNRPEFVACDLGAVSVGGVPFSIYQTASPEQIAYQVSDAGARVAITETALLDRLLAAREAGADIDHIVVVDGDGGDSTLDELMEADPDFDPSPIAADIGPDDLLTLIYTSGTTGPPKGVQLSHRNLLSLVSGVEEMIPLPDSGGKVISWLPAAHIAERGANYYLPVVYGLSITICPEPRKIIEFLPVVKPTWFFAVPRIWEKAKSAIEGQIAGLPDEQREPAQKAIAAAIQKVRLEQAGEEVPDELAQGVAAADAAMFADIRSRMGLDEVVSVNVGAAPTPVEVLEFFHAIGIPVGELWGMSETCGVATCNPPGDVKLGTVGPPVPGMEVKLADDGEVLVKGDSIMPGYRNMPEATEATFEDGWLLTGDIGELDEDGYLKIVDRKKELIINAAGKNMSPANIESKLKLIPLVDQAVAIGDRRKYNTALLTLDPEAAAAWAEKHGADSDVASLSRNEELLAEIENGVVEANEALSRVEQVKKFKVLPEPWDPGGDELTPTMKLKRRPIAEKYEEQIEELYAE
jgi:long-subunit acyl-CoA synthetase (AMP-forming)